MNETTRKYPRTLTEAFGPYADSELQEQYSDDHDGLLLAVCLGALAAVIFLVFAPENAVYMLMRGWGL